MFPMALSHSWSVFHKYTYIHQGFSCVLESQVMHTMSTLTFVFLYPFSLRFFIGNRFARCHSNQWCSNRKIRPNAKGIYIWAQFDLLGNWHAVFSSISIDKEALTNSSVCFTYIVLNATPVAFSKAVLNQFKIRFIHANKTVHAFANVDEWQRSK